MPVIPTPEIPPIHTIPVRVIIMLPVPGEPDKHRATAKALKRVRNGPLALGDEPLNYRMFSKPKPQTT